VRDAAARVEDVELGLRAEVGGVGQGRAAQGHIARVTAVRLAGLRIVHETRDIERLGRPERVQPAGPQIRQQQHVGLVDLLESAHRRPVEGDAVGDQILAEQGGGDRKLFLPIRQFFSLRTLAR